MKKADEIVHELKRLRIKARKDIAVLQTGGVATEKFIKLSGMVSGLNIAIISATQIAKRKE